MKKAVNRVFLNDHRLADKGWEQMRSILDKEMPQPRKRRPFLWWWAAAACVAGICFMYDRDNSGQQQQNILATESSPVVTAEQSDLPHLVQQQSANVTNASTVDKTVSPARVNHSGIASSMDIRQSAMPPSFTEKGVAGTSDFAASETVVSPVFTPGAQPVTISDEPVSFVAGVTGKVNALGLLPSAALTIAANVVNPEMPSVPYKPVTKKAVVKNNSSKFSFGFTAGANAFQVKQLPGFLGGFTVDLALPGRKFGLQSGLIYRYQVFSGESRPVIPVAYDKYVHATANYDIQPDNFPNSWLYLTANNSILIPVMKSHQIEMPVMLFWQMHTRWRMYGGMTLLRHVWVESAEKGLFTYDLQVVTTPDDKAAGNLNNVITGQLPAWEKNWQTGLGFKINRRLELNLFYRSAWKGKPLLSDVSRLFDTCKDCNTQYPEAATRTIGSLRPRSLQLNATIKF